jgi:hypothetical protein
LRVHARDGDGPWLVGRVHLDGQRDGLDRRPGQAEGLDLGPVVGLEGAAADYVAWLRAGNSL